MVSRTTISQIHSYSRLRNAGGIGVRTFLELDKVRNLFYFSALPLHDTGVYSLQLLAFDHGRWLALTTSSSNSAGGDLKKDLGTT